MSNIRAAKQIFSSGVFESDVITVMDADTVFINLKIVFCLKLL